ncbi:hypothetical protein V1264_012720 [Littorina saxatilis]|uniref:Uncharacterized protein n=1 Tax=Littorina saxatilis TaxID=31220 RepID=A0AAN9BY73_9CAEN
MKGSASAALLIALLVVCVMAAPTVLTQQGTKEQQPSKGFLKPEIQSMSLILYLLKQLCYRQLQSGEDVDRYCYVFGESFWRNR